MALPVKKTAAKAEPVVNFGDLSSDVYSHGGSNFDLPEGDYVLADLNVITFTGFNADKPTDPRLGVMVDIMSLDNPGEPILLANGQEHPGQIFYSLGSTALKSFVPNKAGTGIVPVAGGTGKIPDSTNWVIFVKSLQDSGLPEGTFTNDVKVLAGTHVHMSSVPEPKERDSFKSKTGDSEGPAEKRYPRNIAVVTEIKDDGKPWEGTGGIPEVEEEAPAKPAVKAAVKTGAKAPVKVPAKKVVEPEPEAEEEATEEDEAIKVAALGAVATVVEKNPKGLPKAALKLQAAKEVTKMYDEDMMNAVVNAYFSSDEALETLLSEVGYTISGPLVKPV